MNKRLNIFLWVLFFSLMAPSGMALASWNAVPGDATYSWKIGMENVLLAVLPSNKLKSSTNSKLTERRLGEVTKVLSGSHAQEGLHNLSAQIITTKESLNKINNAKDRGEAVALYIQTLNQVNSQLETEQQSRSVGYLPPQQANTNDFSIKNLRRQTNPTSIPQPTTQPADNKPVIITKIINNTIVKTVTKPAPTIQPSTPTLPPTSQPTSTNQPIITQPPATEPETNDETIDENVSDEIDNTQKEIEETIKELENIAEEAKQEQKDENNSFNFSNTNTVNEDNNNNKMDEKAEEKREDKIEKKDETSSDNNQRNSDNEGRKDH